MTDTLRYEAVLLDVGGTLVGPRASFGEVYARVLAPLGLERPVAVFDAALRAQWQEMDRLLPRGKDRYSWFAGGERAYWLHFVRGVVGRLGVDGDLPGDFADRVLDGLRDAFRDRDAWEVFDDVVPTLTALRNEGARMAVVSNWDSRLPAVLERLDLARYFDAVVVSGVEGVEKPDPLLFRRALDRLGADAASAVHVGDVPELDLDGARAAGVAGVLVDRAGRLDPDLGALPDLGPLPGIVRNGTRPRG